MSDKELVDLVDGVKAGMDEFKSTNAKVMEGLKASVDSNEKVSADAIAKADKHAEELAGISASILDLQQKLVAGVEAGKEAPKSLGETLVQSEAFADFAAGKSQKLTIQANTIIGQDGGGASDRVLVDEQRLPGIIPGQFRGLRMRDVIPQSATTSNAIEYTRELAFTNNAAETAEGATKPETDLTFELLSTPVRTIAHFIKLSKQIVDDAPALQSYVDTRMRYGVELRYDQQILNGDGTGQNLDGILANTSNHTVFTPTAGDNAMDSVNKAIYAVIANDYQATAVVMNPADWGNIERQKVGSDDVRYVVGNPTARLGPTLWGLPVIVTNNIAAGKFMVGDFAMAYGLFNRQDTVLEMFEQDTDNVQKNLLTLRAERRSALATFVPAAVQAGDLTA